MDRRGFFKILSTTSAGIAATSCGHKTDALIPMLVPEHEIVPGEEQWHPAVCTECAAGCGTIVRVMEGVRTVERNGAKFQERIAAVKKIEGNPLDPVSGGRLCARGQASVQALYHPDRLRGPMKRIGERGKFAPISWDEAIAAAADKLAHADRGRIAFITGPHLSTRSLSIARFLQAIGAPGPVMCSLPDFAAEREAAEDAFGWKGLPVYDIAHAHTILGVGADFLGGWTSPVYYTRQYGAFRQGGKNARGRFFHAESRLSLTASAADRWLPIRPGTERQFLAVLAKLLFDSWFPSVDVKAFLAVCGTEERHVREAAAELKESPAPLIVGSEWFAHILNKLLGNIGKAGGVLPPGVERPTSTAVPDPQVVLIDGANPAYTRPGSLSHAATIISFSGFLDESAALADLILPGHHALESEMAVVPAVSPQAAVSIGTPFIRPLYETRSVETTLGDIARKLGVEYHAASVKDFLPADADLKAAIRQGGWWWSAAAAPPVINLGPPILAGGPGTPPREGDLLFQAYPSVQFGDGSGHAVPWLQEVPDPASSAIWGLPVEIDPQTAARYAIANGDTVRLESPHGVIEAPAYVHPGAIPGVLSMAIGGGRGANPLTLLADAAFTPVRLSRAGGRRSFIQFSTPDREEITRR